MYCTACGTQLSEASNYCGQCGQSIRTPHVPVARLEEELRFVLPVGTPFWAIAAGYLGLFSILIAPAPFAVVAGILGLRKIKKSPGSHGIGRCWTGILLGGIFSALGAFFLLSSLL